MQEIYFDKWIHAGLFGVLVFLFLRAIGLSALQVVEKNKLFYKVVLSAIVWGFTTEIIQKYFIPGRSFDLTDWAADIFGILVAFTFCRRIYRRNLINSYEENMPE